MMKRLVAIMLVVLVAAPVALVSQAQAQVKIDITRGRVEPMPIAITTFAGSNDQSNRGDLEEPRTLRFVPPA
jgi:TolB protein